MKTILSLLILLAFAALSALAAEQTWDGRISDSICGAVHKSALEHDKKMPDHDCTLACVAKGAQYVFVYSGKVYSIGNQDFTGLEEHAGHTVKLTGDLSGDTITVSKIETLGS